MKVCRSRKARDRFAYVWRLRSPKDDARQRASAGGAAATIIPPFFQNELDFTNEFNARAKRAQDRLTIVRQPPPGRARICRPNGQRRSIHKHSARAGRALGAPLVGAPLAANIAGGRCPPTCRG